jgi:hypothetical protein
MQKLTVSEMREVQGGGGTCSKCHKKYKGLKLWHLLCCAGGGDESQGSWNTIVESTGKHYYNEVE